MRFSEKDYEKYKGETMYGRVMFYNRAKGFGVVHTELGNNIFLSSYDLGKKLEKKICVGMLFRFTPEQRGDKFAASNIEVIKTPEVDEKYILPNGVDLRKCAIKELEYVPGIRVVEQNPNLKEELENREISVTNLDHVSFILNKGKNFKIFDSTSVVGDEYIKVDNLRDYWYELKKEFFFV